MQSPKHPFARQMLDAYLKIAKRRTSKLIPNIDSIPDKKDKLAALEKWAPEIIRQGHSRTYEAEAKDPQEKYSVRVFEHMDRLLEIPNRIRTVSCLVESMITVSPPATVSHTELLRHHLVVLRVLNVSAADVALRLVAVVWDIGISERDIKESIIVQNSRSSTELKDALKRLHSACGQDQRSERNRIVHEGETPSLYSDVGAIHLIEQVQDFFDEELVGPDQLRAGFEPGVRRILAKVETEVVALEDAIGSLLTVLKGAYTTQSKAIGLLSDAPS